MKNIFKQLFLLEFYKNNFLLIFGVLFLVWNRVYFFMVNGYYGFGYDLGIYKYHFEKIHTWIDVFNSQIYFLPSTLALIFNKIGLPITYLLYYGYLLFAITAGILFYRLCLTYFGKYNALISLMIFSVAFAQVMGVELYFFKTILGLNFMLLTLIFFKKRSFWTFVFILLTGLTQLPQLAILLPVMLMMIIFTWREHIKFNLISLALTMFAGLGIFLLMPDQVVSGFNLIFEALKNTRGSFNPHLDGTFLSFWSLFGHSFLIIIFGCFGFILSIGKKEFLGFQLLVAVLLIIIIGELFFQNRYTFELELFLIPFVSLFILEMCSVFLKKNKNKLIMVGMLLLFAMYSTYLNSKNIFLAVQLVEQQAFEVLSDFDQSDKVMVVSDFLAPWLAGYTNKEVMATSNFIRVLQGTDLDKYLEGNLALKQKMLAEIALKQGSFYLFDGERENIDGNYDLTNNKITLVFRKSNTRIYFIRN